MLHFYFPSAVSGSIGDKLGFADPKRYSSKFEFYDKEFLSPENIDKLLSVQYLSLDRPEITKTLTVDLS